MKRPRGICKYCKCLAPPDFYDDRGEFICMIKNRRLKKPPASCDGFIDVRTYLKEDNDDNRVVY